MKLLFSTRNDEGPWYAQSTFDGKFDFNNPASATKKAELDQAQYWRELNNRVEGVGPANSNAGEVNGISIIDLLKNLPHIIDRYREIAPDIWCDLKDYFLPNSLDIGAIDYDIKVAI